MTRFAEASFNLARLLKNFAPTAKAVPKSRSGKLEAPIALASGSGWMTAIRKLAGVGELERCDYA
jgi:hypothetical protein